MSRLPPPPRGGAALLSRAVWPHAAPHLTATRMATRTPPPLPAWNWHSGWRKQGEAPSPASPSSTESANSLSLFSRNHSRISWHGVLQDKTRQGKASRLRGGGQRGRIRTHPAANRRAACPRQEQKEEEPHRTGNGGGESAAPGSGHGQKKRARGLSTAAWRPPPRRKPQCCPPSTSC